ncbi:hypothetical protein ACFL6P_10520 [Candidatus Latescibacterota bacterium]
METSDIFAGLALIISLVNLFLYGWMMKKEGRIQTLEKRTRSLLRWAEINKLIQTSMNIIEETDALLESNSSLRGAVAEQLSGKFFVDLQQSKETSVRILKKATDVFTILDQNSIFTAEYYEKNASKEIELINDSKKSVELATTELESLKELLNRIKDKSDY